MRRASLRRSELCAIDLLCRQSFASIYDLGHPAVDKFVLPVEVTFDSFASFCQKTGYPRAELGGAGADGMTLRQRGQYIVLWNETIENDRRRAFTLAHEVGHILLGHAGEAPETEEKEANAFAASLLCPAIAARYLEKRDGVPMTEERLSAYFFLSGEAAKNRLRDLHRRPPSPPADVEIALLLHLFGRLVDNEEISK